MRITKSRATIMRDSLKDARQAVAALMYEPVPMSSRKMLLRHTYDKIGRALFFLQSAKEER